MRKQKEPKQFVTEAVRAAAIQAYIEEHRVDIEKAARAAALDKAIVAALKKHKVKLKRGNRYLQNIGGRGACVCAIGAALLTRVENKKEAKAIEEQSKQIMYGVSGREYGDEPSYDRSSTRAVAAWATGIVDEGITTEDLRQLETGFEDCPELISGVGLAEPDRSSPFFKLGQKLKKLADGKRGR